jgi:hypothetical protein
LRSDYELVVPPQLEAESKELILTLAAGRPGLAAQIVSNIGLVEKLKEINKNFEILKSENLAEKLKLAYDLADLETSDLKQTLEFWLVKLKQDFANNPNTKNMQNLTQINQSRKYLDQNVNSKLLLTNLMLNLI